ncbi:FadR/GntR family transcriptional regulator [Hyphomicrobium sp.]|uniref:FadR/GntR family transcriptional regulator n=1 Tax=Hyphomicrobium sp. TaxID=82 RepID=UPI002E3627D4|nr:FCD domain-containing protein [Hyphomicrobium sp.]HEX2840496.1 FCD domain-containing protein [Hyphomicrobium sp.]
METVEEIAGESADTPPWEKEASPHPIVRQSVKTIATRVFERIVTGEYPFGTRIPAERELAAGFGETRNAVRQALDFLVSYGTLARRPGGGTFVAHRTAKRSPSESSGYINVAAIAETVSPFEMNIAESILEPEIVRLATVYMSIRDLAKLRSQLERLDSIVADAEQFALLEKQFMMTICEGTHNSPIVCMYRVLHEVRRQPQWCAIKRRALTPARIREAQRGLRSLFAALERRDVDTAVECMRLYLSSAQEGMHHASP